MNSKFFMPDFMIIGAPKCGTTSLAAWLAEHEKIYMCKPKEPYYFSTDIVSQRAAKSDSDYCSLFDGAGMNQVLGEASTTYLRSHVAIPEIIKRRSTTKFIVCLRNPIEMMPSVHMQLYQGGREPISDPAEAWRLQESRRQGKQLPAGCIEPADLDYSSVCALGHQVERLLIHVPRSSVHFVFSDEMRAEPGKIYRDVLHHIGVSDDGRESFENLNTRKAPKSAVLSQALAHASNLRGLLGLSGSFGMGGLIARINQRPAGNIKELDSNFFETLKSYFSNDIKKLSCHTGRDLSEWLL
ncbi:ATP-binding protein [Halomonas sp. 18H]|nr:ATP-binding protein [Halomonas sp. 18H]MCW4153900.1 ATP-binding protein [Halomonas sp. 18H]